MISKIQTVTLLISLLVSAHADALLPEIGLAVTLGTSTTITGYNIVNAYRMHNEGEAYKKKLQEMGATVKNKKELIGHGIVKTGYWVSYPSQCSQSQTKTIHQLSEKLEHAYLGEMRHTMSGTFFGLLSAVGIAAVISTLYDEMRNQQQRT